MKLWKIFGFEFTHQLRRSSTWIYLVVLLAFAIMIKLMIKPGDGVYPNNTFHITSVVVIGTFIWLVMGAAIAGEAASRDVQKRMHPLTYTSPVTKLEYLGGRFLAAFVLNALLILALPLGTLFAFSLGLDDRALLPFRPSAYLSVYFFIALPNVLVATTLQFAFAALTQRVMTSYMASVLLAVFPQLIAVAVAKLFSNWDLVKLFDPIGLAGIIGSELATWTPTEKNTRLVTLEGMFLLNRILWLSVAVATLGVTYFRFRFDYVSTKSWWSRFRRSSKTEIVTATETAFARPAAIDVPIVNQTFRASTGLHQTLTIARTSFKNIAKNPAGLTVVMLAVLLSVAFSSRILVAMGIPVLPTTQQILSYLVAPIASVNSPWIIIPLLIMYFAGQLVWDERDAGINDIADAAPVSEWALFTGKFLGLAWIIIVWLSFLMIGGILIQVTTDYNNFEANLYLKALFGFQLVEYLLFALLALTVHVIVNQKNIAYLVVLLAFLFLAFPSSVKVEHNMLVYGAAPQWTYTDMRGFGDTIMPWVLFKLYWAAWALLLAVVGRLLWARGREQNFKHRVRSALQRFTGSTVIVTIIGSGLVIVSGGFVFYNTNVLNEYTTSNDINEKKAEYERRYGQYRNIPQPMLADTKLEVSIYPAEQIVDVRAAYTLVNDDSVAIDSIHLGTISGIEPKEVKFSRAAAAVVTDKELGHYIYTLRQPLLPGDSVQIDFTAHYEQIGFSNNGTDGLIVEKDAYITNYNLLPFIGYKQSKEINDAVTRREYNLPQRAAIPSLYDNDARKKPWTTDHNHFEAIVSTTSDHVAVGPGALQRTWTEGDRSYFHYKTDAPLRGEYAFVSANYALKESSWNGVAINLYYHPQHSMNVDRMLESVKAAMAYYTEQFGPYPFGHLTLVEHGPGGGASAEASMIDYGEQYSIMNPDVSANGFDLPYYILAHEVAHQWFGSAQLNGASVEGLGVLIEGVAVYAGMQVLENKYGDAHLQQYVNYLHSFYEMPRSLATNSLLRANETFLYYRKGGLAMYVMSKYIGKEKVNGALRDLLQKHKSGTLPLPTTLDLYDELTKVTPDSLNYLLEDLFARNIYWRLKTRQVAAEKTEAGEWLVTLEVDAQKIMVDSKGAETNMPMNDWLDIGIYDNAEGQGAALYLKMHRIQSGEQTLKITVPKKPALAGIDPNNLMIDIRRDDNTMQIK